MSRAADSCSTNPPSGGAAVEVGRHRRRVRVRAGHRPGVPRSRRGVHAAAGRGLAPLHAVDDAGHLGRRGAEAARESGPDHQDVPRGRARARQGRPGGDRHRPCAALDVRDGDRPEADIANGGKVATWYSAVGARSGWSRCSGRFTPDHIIARRAGRRDGSRAAVPGVVERVDDADQGAHRHAHRPASGRRSASRCSAATSPTIERIGARRRSGAPRRPGHAQRLRRARRQRLLPRLRLEPRTSWRATAWASTRRRWRCRPRSAARTSPRPSKDASATR